MSSLSWLLAGWHSGSGEKVLKRRFDHGRHALSLIQKWVRPDDKVTDISAFYDALVKAITDAHKDGEDEGQDEVSAEEGQDEVSAELETTDAASAAQ